MTSRRTEPALPRIFGLFDKRIDGDDCLWELARLRFEEAGLGAELHAATPEQLDWTLHFQPSGNAPVMVHLPREFNLVDDRTRERIVELASRFAGRVCGFVLHDHAELASSTEEFLRAARELNSRLRPIRRCPRIFIEYAAGLEPSVFAAFFAAIRRLPRISACIDTGHVGVQAARRAYALEHPGEDVCALKSEPSKLPRVLGEVEAAVRAGLPVVLGLISELGALGKPLHFHLHDAHPLSTFSPFGVSDHLSFLGEMPIGFDYQGRRSLPLMFGREGLARIVSAALAAIGPRQASFTLEIHPTSDRQPLGHAAPLFDHWIDKTNAERTNCWLEALKQNRAALLRGLTGKES
jgi:hypothetical protein